MRPGLILLLIGLPGAAMATEDRYGPSRRPDPALTVAASTPPAAASGYGGEMLSWSSKPAAVRSPPADAAPSPQVYAPRAPAPAQAAAGLPTSLYDPARTVSRPAPPSAAAPATPPALTAGSAYGNYQPRAYSVVREYGGTPDRIPAPPPQSAFSGPEVALIPGLLGGAPQNDPAADNAATTDEDPDAAPARRKVKDSK